jgi:hypothetical protein
MENNTQPHTHGLYLALSIRDGNGTRYKWLGTTANVMITVAKAIHQAEMEGYHIEAISETINNPYVAMVRSDDGATLTLRVELITDTTEPCNG